MLDRILLRCSRVDEHVGLQVRKDARGLLFRHIESLHLKAAQRRSPYVQDPALRAKIDNEGYELGKIFDQRFLEEVREAVRPYLMDDEYSSVSEVADVEINRSVVLEQKRRKNGIPDLACIDEVVQQPDIVRSVRSYFGTGFTRGTVKVIQNQPFPPDKDVGLHHTCCWHIDSYQYWNPNEIRLLIYLTDQTSGGGTEVITAAKTREILSEYSYEELYEQQPSSIAEAADIKRSTGERGSALLFNPLQQLHRGVEPVDGPREILVLSLMPV